MDFVTLAEALYALWLAGKSDINTCTYNYYIHIYIYIYVCVRAHMSLFV